MGKSSTEKNKKLVTYSTPFGPMSLEYCQWNSISDELEILGKVTEPTFVDKFLVCSNIAAIVTCENGSKAEAAFGKDLPYFQRELGKLDPVKNGIASWKFKIVEKGLMKDTLLKNGMVIPVKKAYIGLTDRKSNAPRHRFAREADNIDQAKYHDWQTSYLEYWKLNFKLFVVFISNDPYHDSLDKTYDAAVRCFRLRLKCWADVERVITFLNHQGLQEWLIDQLRSLGEDFQRDPDRRQPSSTQPPIHIFRDEDYALCVMEKFAETEDNVHAPKYGRDFLSSMQTWLNTEPEPTAPEDKKAELYLDNLRLFRR